MGWKCFLELMGERERERERETKCLPTLKIVICKCWLSPVKCLPTHNMNRLCVGFPCTAHTYCIYYRMNITLWYLSNILILYWASVNMCVPSRGKDGLQIFPASNFRLYKTVLKQGHRVCVWTWICAWMCMCTHIFICEAAFGFHTLEENDRGKGIQKVTACGKIDDCKS